MKSRLAQAGFSLVELAIGLVIVATLLSTLLIPLARQIEQRRTAETQRLLSEAREALLTFAAVNRRLPCPATAASNGAEVFDSGGTAANGECAFEAGFLPAATLGLSGVDPQGYLSDPFGEAGVGGTNTNRIRYAVRSSQDGSFLVDGVANPFTATARISGTTPQPAGTVSLQSIASGTGYLTVCAFKRANAADTSCTGTKATVTNYPLANGNAIAVLYSLGENGPRGVFGPDETENANDHLLATPDRFFVSRAAGNVAGDEYDDLVVWISPTALLSRMLAAGALP
jgi:prepilin-type N-terminal cleavage/methylation domain-containing protein